MSKADDVFIRQFIIVLVLLAAYGVAAGVLGVWIAGSAKEAAAGSERATLERIAPVGRLKLGEPGQRARIEADKEAGASGTGTDTDAGAGAGTATADAADTSDTTDTADTSSVQVATAAPAAAAPVDKVGETIYKQFCFACHLTGVAEAPKSGDTEAWAERAAAGFDAMYQNVNKGKGAMPPRAGFPHLSDDELKAGIRYMLALANLSAE